jgi:hypothetical protein
MTVKMELLKGLARTPALLIDLVASIPEDKRHRRRGDGFWTVAEHVEHLAQVQPMLGERIRRFIEEPRPVFTPYFPPPVEDTPPEPEARPDLDAALADFTAGRRGQIRMLEEITDDAVWQRCGEHPEYDDYSLPILVRHILMHDHWHMYRMEELWLTKDEYLTILVG